MVVALGKMLEWGSSWLRVCGRTKRTRKREEQRGQGKETTMRMRDEDNGYEG